MSDDLLGEGQELPGLGDPRGGAPEEEPIAPARAGDRATGESGVLHDVVL